MQIWAERLRKAAAASGLTQTELGKAIHRAESTVSLYLSGDRRPDPDTLARLCRALRVSADWVLGVEEAPGGVAAAVSFVAEPEAPEWKGPERGVVVSLGERIAETRGQLDEIAVWLGRYVDEDERNRWEGLREAVRAERGKARKVKTRPGTGGKG